MLEPLRQQVSAALASTSAATIATSGPGGLHADSYPCEALNLRLYLLLPRTSDHLVNLENDSSVVVLTERWRLHGEGHVLPADNYPEPLALQKSPDAKWRVVVEVRPTRLELEPEGGWGYRETIDLNL